MRLSHHTEAAAHAGLNVAAAERGHFAQLPRDLDGLVEQQAEVTLVRQAPGARHLPEQVCKHQATNRQHRYFPCTAAIYTASLVQSSTAVLVCVHMKSRCLHSK